MVNVEHALLRGEGAGLPAASPLRHRPRPWIGQWRRRPHAARLPVNPPQPLLAGDGERGRAMLHGQITLAGSTIVAAPANLFRITAAPHAWHEAVITLGWLQDLAAAPQDLSRLTARSLVSAWSRQAMRGLPVRKAARALIELSIHSGFLLDSAGEEFSAEFSAIIGRLARRMEPSVIEDAETAVLKGTALASAAVTFRFAKSTRDAALVQVSRSIDKIVLPDGGHMSRCPARLVQLALDLIPLQRALRLMHLAVPAPLNAALERLLPMLRLLSHGDGALAALQDGANASRAAVQAVLAADTSCGRPLALAPYAGFGRLAYDDGTLLMDTGTAGPCSSALAFEFSQGNQRLIVSCGRPSSSRHPWHAALSSAAAHSTWDMDRAFASLAPAVVAETISSPQGGLLRASLQARGWRRRALHQRSLFLAASGADLRGEDHVSVEGENAGICCLRFHLHPLVLVERASHPNCVSLGVAGDKAWMFSQAGGTITIEDSIYCDAGGKPQPSRQIVIRSARAGGLDVQWALRRMARTLAAEKQLPAAG